MIIIDIHLRGGPLNDKSARVGCPKFEIGMILYVNGIPYKVCDGPVNRAIQLEQSTDNNLMATLEYCGVK